MNRLDRLFDFLPKPRRKMEDLFYDNDRVSEIDPCDFIDGGTCYHDVRLSECNDAKCVEEWAFRYEVRDNPRKSMEEILQLLGDVE